MTRELQALAAVHGQYLNGVGVGLQTAHAVLGACVAVVGGHPPAQPAGQRCDAQPAVDRRGVQQLAKLAQIGQFALAAEYRQQPLGQTLCWALIASNNVATPLRRRIPAHVCSRCCSVVPTRVVGVRDVVGRPTHERRERRGARARQRLRPLQCL